MKIAEPNSTEEVYRGVNKVAEIDYNENGKPSQIRHFCLNTVAKTEEFEYAQKQNGSYVVSKEKIYNHKNDKKMLDEEISFYKHHNGVITVTSSDGRGMSYSLRHETIRNYDNTPKPLQLPTEQPKPKVIKHDDGTVEEIPVEHIFIKPNAIYPQREYTYSQRQQIDDKFQRIKSEYAKVTDPNGTHAFMFYEPVIKDLDTVKALIYDTKDPVIQDKILQLLSEMKDTDLKVDQVGNFNHIDIYSYDNKFTQVYQLAKLSALIDENNIGLDKYGNVSDDDLAEKLIYTGNDSETLSYTDMSTANKIIEHYNFDENLTKSERAAQINGVVHELRYELIAQSVSRTLDKFPDIKEHLVNTYVKQNIESEYLEDLNEIEKLRGKTIIPYKYNDYTMEALVNFHNLPDLAKSHYLKHPELCHKNYLHKNSFYGTEQPYDALKNLSEDEWRIFEERNIGDIIDVITGHNNTSIKDRTGKNIHAVIEMSDDKWKKLNDFKLLEINGEEHWYKSNKYCDLKFDFDQMQEIIEDFSYDEWDTAKRRGIIDMTSTANGDATNNGQNISIPIILAATRVPESTFNFLKNIKLFEHNYNEHKMFITRENQPECFQNIAEGISFLAKSHNDVYQNVQSLIDAGVQPDITMELVGICANSYDRFGKYVTGKIFELKDKGVQNVELPTVLPMYIDLQTIKNKSNINELSIEEKRSLLKNVIKYNTFLFQERYANLLESPIVPKNKEEYCALLPKLVKSIGIDTRPVTQEVLDKFDMTMESMANPSSEFLNTKFTKDGPKLELEYSRKEFILDVLEKVKDISDIEKMKVYDYFGFDLMTDKNGTVQMHGYPVNINNGAKLTEIKDENTRQVVESVRPLVEKFSHSNVKIDGKPELSHQINDILELFPEFRTTIGKEQHGTHDLTVDTHILKVLQGVMSDESYQSLSAKDKKIINIATLLHDLTKAEKLDDKTHAFYSAYDSYHLLSKMNMTENEKLRVYQIIKNHEWLADYNKKVKVNTREYREKTVAEKNKIAKDVAFELKDETNFELANILTKADLKGVKETDEFYDKYLSALEAATTKIQPLVENIKKTAIHLPQTKIPKASELVVDGVNVREIITKDKDGNDIKNRIIYLQKDMDLGAIGFEKGLKSEDLNVIVHALDYDTQSATFQALGNVDSDSLLSASYVNYKKENYHVFRQQGFILDVNSADIQAGTYKDFGSGYGKDLKTLKSQYMFDGKRKDIRNFMSDKVKKKLKLSDEEYKKLYVEIADKSITELDKSNPDIAKAMREIIDEMDVKKRSYGRDYNEWLISRPKIQGVFLQSAMYKDQDPPEFLAKYAADNDLPIIYFGE